MQLTPLTFPAHIFNLQNNVILDFSVGGTSYAGIGQHLPVLGLQRGYVQPDIPEFTSNLGLPAYGQISLGSTDPNSPTNTYTDINGNTQTFDTVHLSLAIMVVNMRKKIIKTAIAGRDGTVKEFIALDDYDITINGVFDNPAGVAPKTDTSLLHRIMVANIPIPVTSYFLNQFGIYFIVIEDVVYPQEMGKYSSQAFTIRAISDYPTDVMFP